MLKAQEATTTAYKESDLEKLTLQRLRAFKVRVYRQRAQFYCESCREYHVDMMDKEEKQRYDQLGENINMISKVQSIKGVGLGDQS